MWFEVEWVEEVLRLGRREGLLREVKRVSWGRVGVRDGVVGGMCGVGGGNRSCEVGGFIVCVLLFLLLLLFLFSTFFSLVIDSVCLRYSSIFYPPLVSSSQCSNTKEKGV